MLTKSIGKLRLTSIQLQNIAVEIEVTLNSRLLIYLNGDIYDQVIIKAGHFVSIIIKMGHQKFELKMENIIQIKMTNHLILRSYY